MIVWTPADSCDGAVGRNTFRAPNNNNLDLAVTRQFNFRGDKNKSFQVRIEALNVLNRAQFGIPVSTLDAPGFGSSVNTTAPNRVVQIALRIRF